MRAFVILSMLGALAPGVVTAAETVAVEIAGFAFDPPSVTVKQGTRVVFVNRDQVPHSVVGRLGDQEIFRSPEQIDTDESFSVIAKASGEVALVCGLHSRITGKIDVAD